MKRSRATQIPLFDAPAPKRTAWRGSVRAAPKSKRESAAPKPWRAVVIGVDTARNSGWSIYACGVFSCSGELDTHHERSIRDVIEVGLTLAAMRMVPCILVLEKPWGGSVDVVAALGAAREAWCHAWRELAGPVGHTGKVLLVAPSTWRAPVLGGYYVRAPREQCRAAEMSMAMGLRNDPDRLLGSDEAAGICIGWYGTRAPGVGKLIGKRARAASLAAWQSAG